MSLLAFENGRTGQARVCQGDAFDLVHDLPSESVDLILTSPPYWGLRTYGHQHNHDVLKEWEALGNDRDCAPPYEWYRDAGGVLGLEPFPSWYVAHLVEIMGRARRALKRSGSLWLNLGDTYFARWSSIRDGGGQGQRDQARQRRVTPVGGYLHDKQLLLIPARFAIAAQDDSWVLRNDLIWSKPNVIPRPEIDRLRLSHEHWFHFVVKDSGRRPTYYYDLESVEAGARDVVSCPPEKGVGGHTATFPSALIRPRILSSSPPGGVVLDLFCGTGRAVVEATDLGRNAIGFELSPDYCAIANAAIHNLPSAPLRLVDSVDMVIEGA